MAAYNAHLLNNMNLDPDTLDLAKAILREATTKTQPGSGHELGSRTTGLPAICAYIASQRLKTIELTRQTAQVASCLRPSDFDKAFHIIQAAIGGNRRIGSRIATYQMICSKYGANEQQLEPFFQQAQRALLQIDGRYDPERMAEVRHAIFFWVYSLWQGKKVQHEPQFADDNKLSVKAFAVIVTVLNDKCKSLKAEILERAKSKASSPTRSAPTTIRRSPQKRPLRELPSKDSPPKKRQVSPGPSQQPAQSSQSRFNLLSELAARPFPETPTKKRKLDDTLLTTRAKTGTSTPLKSILRTSPRKGSTTSTPSRVTLDVSSLYEDFSDSDAEIDTLPLPSVKIERRAHLPSDASASDTDAGSVDESDNDNTVDLVQYPSKSHQGIRGNSTPMRRFRPVYLDYKQWNTLDPRLRVIYTTT
ncbi:hypothetical protein AX17_006691 [Amanita inopinata Kibby_2008]|nr:hypothetical protein AX17_006691 [Amanita inopinata Kibby_2008]